METDHSLLSGAEEEKLVLKQTSLFLLKEKQGKNFHMSCVMHLRKLTFVCVYTHSYLALCYVLYRKKCR